ncbi:MAG: tetratricopeptide repeat protein [Caldimonas sp.]
MTQRTLLFTDVVDSTRLVERLGDAVAADLWARHDRCARNLMALHGGREIDRSDGFFLLFERPAGAARFAVAYRDELAALGLRVRVGMHVGPVGLHLNDAADVARGAKPVEVEGLAKPMTARIMSLAGPGQILVSADAVAALAANLPEACETRRHGHYRLKGVEAPIEIHELGDRAAPFEPPADVDKAYRVVHSADVWMPVREVSHNLPAERDAFVGRVEELRALARRLDGGARLVTLMGPAGTGKTRLARRYGLGWLGDWPGGVFFCDLSDARSLDGILFEVGSALGVPIGRGDGCSHLGNALAGRGKCLLVLDNFEQVQEHAAATVGRWLDLAAEAAVVVTSRERLHLRGEEVLAIEPMPVAGDAIELFRVRALAQRPGFVLGESNRAAVTEVVRLLDGLPLAIELAAARMRVLSVEQLVERMRNRFALLSGGGGSGERQATLRAAIDWSWHLLEPWERAALAQCSTFDGGFTLEAAEAVLDLAAWPDAPPTMDIVQSLVDKSLVRTWIAANDGRFELAEPYFGMYLSIHDYASERLSADGGEPKENAQVRHGRFFAGFGEETALDSLLLHGGTRRRRLLALELDNLVSACRRALRRSDADVAVPTLRAMWEVLELRGPFGLACTMGRDVLALEGLSGKQRALGCIVLALACSRSGLLPEAEGCLDEALSLATAGGDRRRQGVAHSILGMLNREAGRMDKARHHLETAIAIHREVGNRRAEGTTLGNLGNANTDMGQFSQALRFYREALVIHREVGNRRDEGGVLGNSGVVQSNLGSLDEALACYAQALAIHRELGNRRDEGVVLTNLGVTLCTLGRLDEAEASLEEALTVNRLLGSRSVEGVVLVSLGGLHARKGQLEQARSRYETALPLLRAIGGRRFEGAALGGMGELAVMQSRLAEAFELFRQGEAILREVDDAAQLAILLCCYAHADLAAGDRAAAMGKFDEAKRFATRQDLAGDSELGHRIAALESALATASPAALGPATA